MKRINFLIIVFIWLLCNAYTCTNNTDTCHRNITFVNKSPRDVYVYRNGYGNHVPLDTTFFIPTISSGLMDYVKSNETKTSTCASRDCFEYWIEKPDGYNIFILDAEVYENIPKDTILKYRLGLKTIHLTLEEMQRSNWTITFTEE